MAGAVPGVLASKPQWSESICRGRVRKGNRSAEQETKITLEEKMKTLPAIVVTAAMVLTALLNVCVAVASSDGQKSFDQLKGSSARGKEKTRTAIQWRWTIAPHQWDRRS